MGLSLSVQNCRAAADDDGLRAAGDRCRGVEDRVSRLLCFDDLFGTPIRAVDPKPLAAAATGPVRKLIEDIEAGRLADETGWLVRARPWHTLMLLGEQKYRQILASSPNRQPVGENSIPHEWTPETVDVFMTRRQADAADAVPDKPAILTLSCENDITTLGVLLPKPIRTLQAKLSLSGDQGSVLQLNWRDIENGDFVIAGRGLESIDTIKAIARFQRIQLQVGYPEGSRAFMFEIGDLSENLASLRTACHW